jgi:hypothetical protein
MDAADFEVMFFAAMARARCLPMRKMFNLELEGVS